jgi:hypothetical protein
MSLYKQTVVNGPRSSPLSSSTTRWVLQAADVLWAGGEHVECSLKMGAANAVQGWWAVVLSWC